MIRLGTYSTFEVPVSNENKNVKDEAFVWLKEQFDKTGAKVRVVMNPHDFGEYPSFEIDYPVWVKDVCDCDDGEDCDMPTEKEEFHEYAEKVEAEYSKLFFN